MRGGVICNDKNVIYRVDMCLSYTAYDNLEALVSSHYTRARLVEKPVISLYDTIAIPRVASIGNASLSHPHRRANYDCRKKTLKIIGILLAHGSFAVVATTLTASSVMLMF